MSGRDHLPAEIDLGEISDALDELYREVGRHETDYPKCKCLLRMRFNDVYRAFEKMCKERDNGKR